MSRKPASLDAIARAQQRLPSIVGGGHLPRQLLRVWSETDGFSLDEAEFYSCEGIFERNETWQTGLKVPGFVAVADDNGCQLALMRMDADAVEVFRCHSLDLSFESMRSFQMGLDSWIKSDCPFESVDEQNVGVPTDTRVTLRLEALPKDLTSRLLRMRELLCPDMSLLEFKKRLRALPTSFGDHYYLAGSHIAKELNRDGKIVSLWRTSGGGGELPIV